MTTRAAWARRRRSAALWPRAPFRPGSGRVLDRLARCSQFARDERLALSETLRRVGPGSADTLCGDWTTAQLVAHLVLRERSVVEAAGRLPVASPAPPRRRRWSTTWPRSAPYDELVDAFERGPRWSEVRGPVPIAWLWSLPPVREVGEPARVPGAPRGRAPGAAELAAPGAVGRSAGDRVAAPAAALAGHVALGAGRCRAALARARSDPHAGRAPLGRRGRRRRRPGRGRAVRLRPARCRRGGVRGRRPPTSPPCAAPTSPSEPRCSAAGDARRTPALRPRRQAEPSRRRRELAEVEHAGREHRVGAGLAPPARSARPRRRRRWRSPAPTPPRGPAGSARGRSRPSCRRRPSS